MLWTHVCADEKTSNQVKSASLHCCSGFPWASVSAALRAAAWRWLVVSSSGQRWAQSGSDSVRGRSVRAFWEHLHKKRQICIKLLVLGFPLLCTIATVWDQNFTERAHCFCQKHVRGRRRLRNFCHRIKSGLPRVSCQDSWQVGWNTFHNNTK